jgi:predicted alpha/beta hydrolase
VDIPAADGYVLKGRCWRHAGAAAAPRPLVVINPATSVCCRYYARFADHLHRHGFDVLIYDYRGIGESRPARLRGFEAGWIDWGRLDVEAALQWAAQHAPAQPIHVVGHSVGGFLIGLAPSSHRVSRIFTVGAQYAHWKDYAAGQRTRMWLRWHLAMPALTALCGYFPGRRLGWLEDTPRGVVRDWTARAARFEDMWRRGSARLDAAERQALVQRFAGLRAELLALSLSDDEFGTVAAVQRLLAYFTGCARTHLHLQPQAAGAQAIGHFAFFHQRFEPSLWPLAREWLQHGRLPAAPQGELRHAAPVPAQAGRDSSAA